METKEFAWRWCLAGNVSEAHEYGEDHELRYGSRPFRPGAKVYVNLVYGGMGHENILVIGTPRHTRRYVEIVIKRKLVCNFRLQKVYRPAVLKQMARSGWDWPGNGDSERARLMKSLEWLNSEEAEKEKRKER